MLSLKDSKIDKDIKLRILQYGDAGTGKTSLLADFPSPIFVFDFDHKLKVLYGKDVDYESFDCGDKEKAASEYERFFSLFRKIKNDPKYKTIAFDSGSLLDNIVERFGIKQLGKFMDVPTLEAYGRIGDIYAWLFPEINSIDKNVVFNAHQQYKVEKESGEHKILPYITGKTSNILTSMFEETYYRIVTVGLDGKLSYRLYYRPYGKATASSQLLKGDGFIENPSYTKIMEQIMKGR